MKLIKKPIHVEINSIDADEFFYATVTKGSGSSARVNVPKNLIGKRVMVIILPENTNKKRREK